MEPPNRGSVAVTGTVTASTSATATSWAATGAIEQNGMQLAMAVGVAGMVLGS